jgi:hypothetical protein
MALSPASPVHFLGEGFDKLPPFANVVLSKITWNRPSVNDFSSQFNESIQRR